jgi:alpha-L-fucosidase 2
MRKILLSLCVLGCGLSASAAQFNDIEYGQAGGESLKLDGCVPEGAGPFPAVILVHGGGWTGGDKSGGPKKAFIAPMQAPLERAGFAWFSINYRLAPKSPFPACVEDVETAIRWVKAHAAEYRIDPKRIALSGESAGGHLVALAATRAKEATRVAAVVPFYGRFDLTTDLAHGAVLRKSVAALMGPGEVDDVMKARLREASPMWQVKAGMPPFLLVHGTTDQTVPFEQSTDLQVQLKKVGVLCDLQAIKGGVHGMISWDKVAPTYQQDVVDWLVRTLKTERAAR